MPRTFAKNSLWRETSFARGVIVTVDIVMANTTAPLHLKTGPSALKFFYIFKWTLIVKSLHVWNVCTWYANWRSTQSTLTKAAEKSSSSKVKNTLYADWKLRQW